MESDPAEVAVVATVECPRCYSEVELFGERIDDVADEEELWDSGTGEHPECGVFFAEMPDGQVYMYELEEGSKP